MVIIHEDEGNWVKPEMGDPQPRPFREHAWARFNDYTAVGVPPGTLEI